MNNVLETIKLGENNTIKSVELVEIINWFRKLESETTDKNIENWHIMISTKK